MDEQLVSVIIPVYNAEKYLERCLSSICDQAYWNIEILIIDDGSIDRSLEICNQWARKDNRIKVIHQINQGVSAARNAGLKYCNGDFCTFVDADDYLMPNFISSLVPTMQRAQMAITGTKYCAVEDKYTNESSVKSDLVYYEVNEDFDINRIHYSNACWGILYNTKLIQNYRITFNEHYFYGEDSLFFYRVLKCCEYVCLLKEKLYIHTINPEGACDSQWNAKRYTAITSAEEKIQLLKDYPKIYIYEKVHITNVYLSVLIKMLQSNSDIDISIVYSLKGKANKDIVSLAFNVLKAKISLESKLRLWKIICSVSKRAKAYKLWRNYLKAKED